ncbi:MAG TPA: AMP-binding protein [Mycobacterium sp.]|nr:AMP-binding protein [Mycobacterium sp.]
MENETLTRLFGPSAEDGPVTEQPYLARRQNWTNQLARHSLMQPDSAALRFLGHTTTWRELDRRVCSLAGALHRRGVEFGDRVLILMLNRTEFIESVLAINKLGAIAVPVNFRMTPSEIAYLVSDCRARVMITEPVLAQVAAGVRDLDATLATVIVTGSDSHADDDAAAAYEDLLADGGADAPAVDIPDDSPALIMYTSGTTGRPKGAVLTHHNLAGQAMTHLFTHGADINNDVGFVGVPLFHIAGIGNTIIGLLLGRPTVLYSLGAFDPGELLDVLEAEQVTGIFLVPAQWQAVCAAQRANPRTLKLRTLSWGAAPASDTLLRKMSEAFAGGWFHSGDLVRQDDEGYVWVVDRKKDMIISGGENIYCAEVENVLAAHPEIVEVAVVGRKHPEWGEVPVAVVVVRSSLAAANQPALAPPDLDEFLTARLARYKHPKAVEVVEALPRNPAGKVLKTELRARFGNSNSIDARESSTPPTVSAGAQGN